MLRVAENLPAMTFQSGTQKSPVRTAPSTDRILVVEDDRAVQRALRRLFEAEGYAVQTADDGASAIELFRTVSPSAVVLDLRLPGMSGRDVCSAIKERAAAVPIAALRRTIKAAPGDQFSFDDIQIDTSKMEVVREGKVIALTAQEFKTLKFMVQNPERVITRDELLNEVWGYHNYPSTRTVDNHILKLRQKLERDPANPVHFRTVHGVGYKFVS